MENKKIFFLLFWLVVFISSLVISYYYFDRRIVLYLFENNSRGYNILKIFANDIVSTIKILILPGFIYFILKNMFFSFTASDKKILALCNSIAISYILKDILKNIFGRTFPATFSCNNPSLLQNHVYGFNWFKGGSSYSSFPSGHATMIFSFFVSMWFLYPKLRWLWVLLTTLVCVGQVGMYYHFLSDVVAGSVLGATVSLFNYKYFYLNKKD
jgi:membrane-associated phospholipid phosphatase